MEFSHITLSWQCWHCCVASNENKMEQIDHAALNIDVTNNCI